MSNNGAEQDDPCRVACESWTDFIAETQKLDVFKEFIFRGQRSAPWALQSKWERCLTPVKELNPEGKLSEMFDEGSLEQRRDQYLQDFKDAAIGSEGLAVTELEHDNDWWALGRHQGLVTPLLDWTTSPFVGAFFAFIDYADHVLPGLTAGAPLGDDKIQHEPVAVWALQLSPRIEDAGHFEIIRTRSAFAQRQRSQGGLFSKLRHDRYIDLVSYFAARNMIRHLKRYEIPGEDFGVALRDLEAMNITYRTLFPDLQGAALHANVGPVLRPRGLKPLRLKDDNPESP